MFNRAIDLSFYLVLDPTVMRSENLELALENAIRGGVRVVQVREKNCGNEEFLALVHRVSRVLRRYQIPLILNDRIDLVFEVGADGVHLGQSDLDYEEARRRLGDQAIIGVSVENFAQAQALENSAVDYLGVSSIFQTPTKLNIKNTWGLEGLRDLRKISSHRLVAIGGINSENANDVLAAGADGLAVVAAICRADHPKIAAEEFSNLIRNFKAKQNENS